MTSMQKSVTRLFGPSIRVTPAFRPNKPVKRTTKMASMKAANRLKIALEAKSEEYPPAFGCWQMLPGSNVSRTLARTGVDWIVVDQEHGNIDGSLKVHCKIALERSDMNRCGDA